MDIDPIGLVPLALALAAPAAWMVVRRRHGFPALAIRRQPAARPAVPERVGS